MNAEPHVATAANPPRRNLEVRLAARPQLRARLHQILDTLDQSVADGCDAHAAEDRVIEALRRLGQEVLGQWAEESHAHLQEQVPAQHPGAIRHGKKNG
jgi:hypothetical protein